jgi:hypothetical protein
MCADARGRRHPGSRWRQPRGNPACSRLRSHDDADDGRDRPTWRPSLTCRSASPGRTEGCLCLVPGKLSDLCWAPLFARGYDLFTKGTEDAGLRARRRTLLVRARGRTLEIGAGTGVNVELYPDSVTELVLTEPDSELRHGRGNARFLHHSRACDSACRDCPHPETRRSSPLPRARSRHEFSGGSGGRIASKVRGARLVAAAIPTATRWRPWRPQRSRSSTSTASAGSTPRERIPGRRSGRCRGSPALPG